MSMTRGIGKPAPIDTLLLLPHVQQPRASSSSSSTSPSCQAFTPTSGMTMADETAEAIAMAAATVGRAASRRATIAATSSTSPHTHAHAHERAAGRHLSMPSSAMSAVARRVPRRAAAFMPSDERARAAADSIDHDNHDHHHHTTNHNDQPQHDSHRKAVLEEGRTASATNAEPASDASAAEPFSLSLPWLSLKSLKIAAHGAKIAQRDADMARTQSAASMAKITPTPPLESLVLPHHMELMREDPHAQHAFYHTGGFSTLPNPRSRQLHSLHDPSNAGQPLSAASDVMSVLTVCNATESDTQVISPSERRPNLSSHTYHTAPRPTSLRSTSTGTTVSGSTQVMLAEWLPSAPSTLKRVSSPSALQSPSSSSALSPSSASSAYPSAAPASTLAALPVDQISISDMFADVLECGFDDLATKYGVVADCVYTDTPAVVVHMADGPVLLPSTGFVIANP
ncbi:hypothetical protein BC831DRAFT_452541 [Entophlyctis helioformis]|nr:hypothetical protein BC831DRAFT_452541 [Entophlyctis helioformis]